MGRVCKQNKSTTKRRRGREGGFYEEREREREREIEREQEAQRVPFNAFLDFSK